MKFRMIIKDEKHDESWIEDEDRPNIKTMEAAQKWAEDTIARFNETLRPFETPRTLISIEDLHDAESNKHVWNKTNLTTIAGKYFGTYDTMECENCRITGKRHGMGDHGVVRDPEFEAVGYASCAKAKVLLERRRKMREKRASRD